MDKYFCTQGKIIVCFKTQPFSFLVATSNYQAGTLLIGGFHVED